MPSVGSITDLLTPDASGDLAAGLDATEATPARVVANQLRRLNAGQAGQAGLRGPLASPRADSVDLASVVRVLCPYFDCLLRSHLPRIRGQVEADLALRSQSLLAGGVQGLFDSMAPFARWRDSVLEVDYPVSRDVFLRGRGLLLVPSFFCWRRPTALADPDLTPTLVYPVAKPPWQPGARDSGKGVSRLIGRTRAAILQTVAGRDGCGGCTSTDIARVVGIAESSITYQMSALRDGGLVSSRRRGKYIVHAVTPLGLRILDGA
ncbi:ArsR/SmtB family transcription factor [Streptomyces turgidiscabies]|uniref:DNA-binding transcriptional ArsR family regulator n=1 Tax=Streptomyces turgidiscabies TaxID=85558 RepID=A0ABU0RGM7_9ACTN|nr:transcriptional regulator [Streptomyces turgidiscabies]MDQ0931136.1 DNA-binding transcriptional ArsR family regulator [Streptomyces turgidiscabies]